MFCFCIFGWFSASGIAWVDIETEPVFLAATADWVLGILPRRWRGRPKTSGQSGPTERGPRPSAGLSAGQGRRCSADLLVAPILGPQRPRARRALLALGCPHALTSKRRCSGTPGNKAALAVPSPQPEPPNPRGCPSGAATYPPRPRREPRRRRVQAADTAGTWARPPRCARNRSRLGPASARPPRPLPVRREILPYHFAPVGGNLRSVTPILKRATCSAGLAAPGGTAGLGRRGVGTLGSGGHAGVGARRRPAAAAR